MTKTMQLLCRLPGLKIIRVAIWSVLLLLLISMGSSLLADPAKGPAAPSEPAFKEDFGQYLVDHESDLAPFFDRNAEDLIRQAMPMVLGLVAWIEMFALIVGWGVDVLLARGFTPFFAPAYTKFSRAMIYATGRLILNLIVVGLFALTVFICTRFLHAGIIILCVAIILGLASMVLQVAWLTYWFRMRIGNSVIFYVIILGAQMLTFALVSAPVIVGKPTALAYRFVNETMTPELQMEVNSTKQDLADVNKATDATKEKLDQLKAKIAEDQAETEKLNKEIEDKKNSEAFLFQKIVRIEAQGDLATAHDQFTAMLAKYPSGTMSDSVKTHLTQIEAAMATQAAQKKQAEADALAAAAAARADLLARAGRGEVTLSEMRLALVGKTQVEVSGLFGQPTETGANKWGYAQQMIFDPVEKVKHGLTVNFTDGTVQGVDYYYGGPKK
jgi:hypothetical protein